MGDVKAATFTETVVTATGQIVTPADGFVEVDPADAEVSRALADRRLIAGAPESVSDPDKKAKG